MYGCCAKPKGAEDRAPLSEGSVSQSSDDMSSSSRYQVTACTIEDVSVDDNDVFGSPVEVRVEAKVSSFSEEYIQQVQERVLSTPTVLQHQSKFQFVKNFRDLASFNNILKPGKLFRSATPRKAEECDVLYLINGLDIRTIVDLREEDEAEEEKASEHFLRSFKTSPTPFDGRASVDFSMDGPRTVRLPLAPKSHYKRNVFRRASMSERAKLVGHGILGLVSERHYKEAKRTGLRVVDRHGLLGLNEVLYSMLVLSSRCKMVLRYNGLGVYRFLTMLSQPETLPALIHCSHGKDRTGLACALVLLTLGVDEASIIVDYVASKVMGGSDVCMPDVKTRGDGILDPQAWSDAHPEVMRSTIRHIETEYHGIEAYLDGIGFDAAHRARLREVLVRDSGDDTT